MTNDEAIAALKQIKTYTAAVSLDAVDYAIGVLEKMNELGIEDPLNLQDVTAESSAEGGES
ncbi:MAG: hypothetical protein J6Z17_00005 [Treponema sp.]|nr:hypothetical protein [Treponema sp.]